jgi:3-hydroxybutyryl-CoA dehydrogenase
MNNISVIGSGTMGNGIAHVFAQNGFEVSLIDVSESALEKGLNTIAKNLDRQMKKELISENDKKETLERIKTHTTIGQGVQNADLVVEAATENVEAKMNIFKQVSDNSPSNAILASNTSSISITKLASSTDRPGKVIGMHFMNPVTVMKLVEVINGFATDQKVTDEVMKLSKKIGKVPVEDYPGFVSNRNDGQTSAKTSLFLTGFYNNNYPGFVSNRILMPMINEAIYTLFEGVAGVKEIDTVMKLGMAHPMGPLHLADFIGLDVCLSILNVLYDGFGNQKYAPCPLLINMVQAGYMGAKSGEGFYKWSDKRKDFVVSDRFL